MKQFILTLLLAGTVMAHAAPPNRYDVNIIGNQVIFAKWTSVLPQFPCVAFTDAERNAFVAVNSSNGVTNADFQLVSPDTDTLAIVAEIQQEYPLQLTNRILWREVLLRRSAKYNLQKLSDARDEIAKWLRLNTAEGFNVAATTNAIAGDVRVYRQRYINALQP